MLDSSVRARRLRLAQLLVLVATLVAGATGCQRQADAPSAQATPASVAAAATAAPADAAPLEPAPEATPLPEGLAPLVEPFKGDFDEMLKRRVIRVLTVQNPVLYSVDRG